MADPGYTPSTSWRDRLPGHPGGPVSPPIGPQADYDYIMANVPGITPAAAQWLHSALATGGLYSDYMNGYSRQGALQGTKTEAVTPGQYAAIMALPRFYAPVNTYSGPPPAPAPAAAPPAPPARPPGIGNWELPPMNPGPDGTWGMPPEWRGVPGTDVSAIGNPHPIHQPPLENQPVPPSTYLGRPLPGHPVHFPPYEDSRTGPGPFGGYSNPNMGPGAHLAERMLGVNPPQNFLDRIGDLPTPVHFLGRHPGWRL